MTVHQAVGSNVITSGMKERWPLAADGTITITSVARERTNHPGEGTITITSGARQRPAHPASGTITITSDVLLSFAARGTVVIKSYIQDQYFAGKNNIVSTVKGHAEPLAGDYVATGQWVRQTTERHLAVYGMEVVDGVPYILCGWDKYTESATVMECHPDGTITEWPVWTSAGWQAKAAAVYGSKIYLPFNIGTGNIVSIAIFDTVTKNTQWITATNPSVSGAQYGRGCLAPDGLIYFPPWRSPSGFANLMPLSINPATNACIPTSFAGQWTMNEHSGTFMVGGEGNRMYFLPGQVTASGGSYQSGTRMGYIDFPSKSVTYMTVPPDPIFSGDENTFYWAIACPGKEGIYAMSMRDAVYRITSTGWTLLQQSYLYGDYYRDEGELRESAEFDGNPMIGADGLIYAVGIGYIDPTPYQMSKYPPVILTIDPVTDEVHFTELYEYGLPAWLPSVTVPFEGGTKMRTWPVECCRSGESRVFENSLVSFQQPSPNTMSYALGAIPVSLALGDVPLELALG